MKKFKVEVAQNLKVCGNKRKIEDFRRGQQDFSFYQNSSKKPRQTFKCDICSKIFQKNDHLKQHIESIHEGKTFKCDICPSSFTQKGHLKRHIESVHEGKNISM